MNKIRRWWIGGAVALGLAAIIGAGAVMAQTPSSTPPAASPSTVPGTVNPSTAPNGTFKSNEGATHEAGETAEQEAAEDSGQFRGGRHGGGSNEDPAHEANESAAREAEEDAGQAPSTAPSGTN